MPLPKNYAISKQGIALGRKLFYENILSRDSSIACASCHQQKNAFADSTQFSEGFAGSKQNRNTLPLFNLAWYKFYFWDGRVNNIEEQIFHPVRNNNEMNLNWTEAVQRISSQPKYKRAFFELYGKTEIDSVLISISIAQFLRTLISDGSNYDKILAGKRQFSADEYEGFELVNDLSRPNACIHCHTTEGQSLGTNLTFVNNGLEHSKLNDFIDKGFYNKTKNNKDIGKFKVPSLRNLKFTAPYMHDGRFKTLEEVLDFYSENVQHNENLDFRMKANNGKSIYSKIEKKKIIAFLNSMNDYEFIKNQKFANPFKNLINK